MTIRTRLARLEVQCAIKPSRELSDAQLDAEIARLSARLGIAHLSPTEMVAALEQKNETAQNQN